MGVFWEGSRSERSVSWCVLQTPAFGVVWHWSFCPRVIQVPAPINPKSLGMWWLGILLCQQRERLGHNHLQHSPNPNPARPWLFLQRSSPPFLSPFGKFRNKNPMLNAIPCVALRTCCRMSLQSPEEGGGSSSSPVFQPLHVQEGAPSPAR